MKNNLPNEKGYFGDYGGSYIPPQLQEIMDEITKKYEEMRDDPEFQEELKYLLKHYVGRPSPIFYAKNLSKKLGGAQIYFKREDLNHTGAHKINHCLGEALLAKKLGKKKVIAETYFIKQKKIFLGQTSLICTAYSQYMYKYIYLL